MRQQPRREPPLERRQERSIGFVRACELLSFNHVDSLKRRANWQLSQVQATRQRFWALLKGFRLTGFEIYPTGVGFLLDQ